MSGSIPPLNHDPAQGADPSMDDILASIRRILSEDETAAGSDPAPAPPPAKPADDGVLMLESSMIVAAHEPASEPAPEPAPMPLNDPQPPAEPRPREPALLAPETAAAAASSVDALMRTLVAERSTQVNRGGPTIEDLVREEIRPVLKAWLDTHLPPLVERLVRAEIERVSGRAAL